jgi:hypothetical protein
VLANDKPRHYARNIGDLARVGLEDGQLNVANEGLTSLQESFARTEGTELRGNYIRKVVTLAARIGIPSLLIAVVGGLCWDLYSDDLPFKKLPQIRKEINVIVSALYVLTGVCLGSSLPAYTRTRTVTFDNFSYFDQDRPDPALRSIFLCIVAAVIGILLIKGWFVVGITKDLLLNDFDKDLDSALILGMLTGYAEANVTRLITGGLESVKDWRAGNS